MLQSLHVRNLAIVENTRVEFDDGLNVITGETGAGKSIFLGALTLVLGGRADRSLIRAGEKDCRIEAVFQLPSTGDVDAVLDELGMDPCEEGMLIVRRTVSASGSGRCFVNDSPATVQALKQVGNLLVDMHGPHDHQSLLNQDFQLDILDAFAHLQAKRHGYEKLYRELLDLEARRRELETDDDTVEQQIDLLSYQVKEIEDADLTDADEDELEQEHAVVANAQRILELAGGLVQSLTESENSAFSTMAFAQGALGELEQIVDIAKDWHDEARSIAVQIQELAATVNSYAQGVEGDPSRLQWIEERMALLRKLKRKYGDSVPAMLEFLQKAKSRLHDLESRHERIAELEQEIADTRKRVVEAGRALGRERRKAAKKLASQVTAELRDLGFAHGAFDAPLDEVDPGPGGTDEIEFGFMPNAGEPMRPLRVIASSGEISRVMLATKAVLAKHDKIPVLVFDEIDANVGGEIGTAVGGKLETVADTHQVLCITHLPQVAVHGGAHFVVEKSVRDGRTHTSIRGLEATEREEEVARMLGGRDLTSVTLEHAAEMLAKANVGPICNRTQPTPVVPND